MCYIDRFARRFYFFARSAPQQTILTGSAFFGARYIVYGSLFILRSFFEPISLAPFSVYPSNGQHSDMKNLLLMVLSSTALLALGVAAHPAKVITSSSLPKSSDQDSHLERVQLVKQETGFDGKVRSIRFNLDPESNDEHQPMTAQLTNNRTRTNRVSNGVAEHVATITSSARLNSKSDSGDSKSVDTVPLSTRSKRFSDKQSSANAIDDLQAQESKVFRPLFVYRQQVAKRLKLKNDKRSSYPRPRVQRMNPNGYYYPYGYLPYRYVPYNY